MTTKTKAILVIIALAVAFASGRWLTPVKTVTVTKTVEVNRKDTTTTDQANKHTVTKIVKQKNKDGSETETTDIVEDDNGVRKVAEKDNTTTTDKGKVVVTKPTSSKVLVSALVGVGFSPFNPVYGASVSKEILGPISAGVWGLTNGSGGLSLGLSF